MSNLNKLLNTLQSTNKLHIGGIDMKNRGGNRTNRMQYIRKVKKGNSCKRASRDKGTSYPCTSVSTEATPNAVV